MRKIDFYALIFILLVFHYYFFLLRNFNLRARMCVCVMDKRELNI